jgi:hypothetical protein
LNSLVSELVLKPSEPKPRWQLGRLSAEELASLVGQTPTPATPRPTKPKAVAAPIPAPEPPPQSTTKPEPEPEPQPAEPALPVEPQPAEPEPAQSANAIVAPNSSESRERESATTAPEENPGENGEQTLLEDKPVLAIQPSAINSEPNSDRIDDDADQPTALADGSEEPAAELPSTTPDAPAKAEDPPNPEALAKPDDLPNLEALAKPEEFANPNDPSDARASGERDAVTPPPITNPDRLTPTTSVVGSARDQVHEDGSLIKPKRKGPLAGIRERLAS